MEKVINKVFNKVKNPIIFEESYMVIGDKEYVLLDSTCFFITQGMLKVTKVGSDWVEDIIREEISYKGYLVTYDLDNLNMEDNHITIIGNVNNYQYKINGVSCSNSNVRFDENVSYFAAKFTALNFEKTFIGNNNYTNQRQQNKQINLRKLAQKVFQKIMGFALKK